MQRSVIEAERELQERLRKSARRELGPEANDAEVEALADEAYWGPEPSGEHEETEAERQDRERQRQTTIATMERWAL